MQRAYFVLGSLVQFQVADSTTSHARVCVSRQAADVLHTTYVQMASLVIVAYFYSGGEGACIVPHRAKHSISPCNHGMIKERTMASQQARSDGEW